MDAKEFLEESSPDDRFGLRATLNKRGLKKMVEKEMDVFANHKVNEEKLKWYLKLNKKLQHLEQKDFTIKEYMIEVSNKIDTLIN